MNTWIALGSGPSAPEALPEVLARYPRATVITCNGGIEILPHPDIYVLIDKTACTTFQQSAVLAKSAGSWLVTLNRCDAALKERCVHWFDEFVCVPGHSAPAPGRYGRFVRSGPFCIEYACMHGADCVVLVGWDGYAAGYHGGNRVDPARTAVQDRLMAGLMAEIRSAWPAVSIESIS